MRTEIPLSDTVTVGGALNAEGDGYIVGSPPVWEDSSDATYAEFAGQYFGSSNPQFVGSSSAPVENPPTPLSTNAPRVIARVRLAAITNGSQKLPRARLVQSGSAYDLLIEPTALAPGTPTWVDYVFDRGTFGDSLTYFLGHPSDFTLRFLAPLYAPPPNETQRWRVYEAQLYAEGYSEAPPCRMFPREDGLGVGAGRNYPPPKSQQRSSRGVGYY